jgi:hypothetical protein
MPAGGRIWFVRRQFDCCPVVILQQTACPRREFLKQNGKLFEIPSFRCPIKTLNFGTHFVVVRFADFSRVSTRRVSDSVREALPVSMGRQFSEACQILDARVIKFTRNLVRRDGGFPLCTSHVVKLATRSRAHRADCRPSTPLCGSLLCRQRQGARHRPNANTSKWSNALDALPAWR